jgi:hypothetical protein
VPDGTQNYEDEPVKLEVAKQAHSLAQVHNDNPISQFFLQASRVGRVWREPGHCPRALEPADNPNRDYRATVRYHFLLGIPGPTVDVTCGAGYLTPEWD